MKGLSTGKVYLIVAGAVTALGLCLVSCAAFGSSSRVAMPEVIPTVKTVAIWPITAVPVDRNEVEDDPDFIRTTLDNGPMLQDMTREFSAFSERLLVSLLRDADLFAFITPDSVLKVLAPEEINDFRLGMYDWQDFANIEGIDCLLVSDVQFKGGFHGGNSYITLSVFDWRSGELVAEAKFNTMWGKSYTMQPPTIRETLPDGLEGAVNALKKAWKKNR